jgi:septal ring factor EnvC (AmiA/AmiB activator)
MIFKKYINYILGFFIIAIGIYCAQLFISQKITEAKNEMLLKYEKKYEQQIASLNENIKTLKESRQIDLDTIKTSNEKITKLEKEVKEAKKPVIINQPKDDKEVVLKITTLYNDPSTQVTNNEFLIKKNTTYGMIYDAEQWKVNGPILQNNLNLVTNLVTEQKFGIEVRDKTIEKDNKMFDILEQRDKVKDKLLETKDKANDNITKQLKTSQKSGKIKFAIGVVSGILLNYVKDKALKR